MADEDLEGTYDIRDAHQAGVAGTDTYCWPPRQLAGHVLRQARELGFVDLYSMFRRLG